MLYWTNEGGTVIYLQKIKKATKQMQALSSVDRECIFYVKGSLAGQTMIRKNKSR